MTKIEQGWSPQCDGRQAEPGEWGVLKVGCMNSGVYDESENKALPPELEPVRSYEIKVGDVRRPPAVSTQWNWSDQLAESTRRRAASCFATSCIDLIWMKAASIQSSPFTCSDPVPLGSNLSGMLLGPALR